MKNKCGIYKIENPIGQIYIGGSKNIVQRYWKYKTSNTKFQRLLRESIEKYGWEQHLMEVIEECSEEDLKCRERYWQLFYDVLNGGLNCIIEACGEDRRINSQSTYIKLSEAKKGENHHFYGKRGEGTPMYGKKHTEESKNKMRESSLGQICSEETRKLLSGKFTGEGNPYYGKTHSNEVRKKMSENHADFRRGNGTRSKLVLNEQTGIFYDCVEDAADTISVKRCTLTSWLNKARPNKSYFIYC